MNRSKRSVLAFSASIIALSGWLASAHAEEARPSPGAAVGEVVVTASRVARAGFSAPTPTTVVGAQDIQRVAATNVANVLNDLPEFRGTLTSTTGTVTVAAGGNFLDLRGLGPTRTLVLVDGQRHVPSNITGQLDINLIPSISVDRTEVVTGGASAAYGSDAVAGVVNIITRQKYVGAEANVQYGISSHGDNRETNVAAIVGKNFQGDRGNFTLAGQYVNNLGVGSPVTRSWGKSEPALISNPLYAPGNGQPSELIAFNVHPSSATNGGLINAPGVLKGIQFGPGGVPEPFIYGSLVGPTWMVGGSGGSLADYQQLETPAERIAVTLNGTYEITPDIEANVRLSWARSHTVGVSGVTFEPSITVRADNAYLPDSIRSIMAANNIASFSMGRIGKDTCSDPSKCYFINTNDDNVYRGVFSLKGNLGGGWSWNAYYEHGRTILASMTQNQRVQAKWTQAIDAVVASSNPASPDYAAPGTGISAGSIVCRSTLTNPTNGCVPFNMFGQFSATEAARNYVRGAVYNTLHFSEDVVSGVLQGEPFSTWAGPVSIATGAEYRSDRGATNVDPISEAGGFYSGGPKAISGTYSVEEVFAETVAPLANGLKLARLLEFNGAVRYTNYNVSGGVTSWKVGLSYKPIDDLRFRATRSQDIRAPNLNELYTPGVFTTPLIIDPTNNSQNAVVVTSTGSTHLTPETATTTTYGVIYQPNWAPRLRASIDAYDISIANVITTLTGQATVNRCAAGATNLCQYVIRNSAGVITHIFTPFINLASLKTNGVDFELDYSIPLSELGPLDGDLTFRWLATYVAHLITSDGVNKIDAAGETGGANVGGVPHWTQTAVFGYSRGPLSLTSQLRFIGAGVYDATATPAKLLTNSLPSRLYTQIGASYTLSPQNGGKSLQMYATVDNLFDVAPPVAPNAFQSYTNAAFFDTIGRTFKMGLRYEY